MREDIIKRFTNHPPATSEVAALFDEVTRRMIELGEWLDTNLPDSREKSLVITKLEETSFWTKACIARNQ